MQDEMVVGTPQRQTRFAHGTGEHDRISASSTIDELGDELAQIIHDLKNPLSSIALEAELLGTRIAYGDPLDATHAVGRIVRNVLYLDRLIQDLGDASTIHSGHFELRKAKTDLRQLVIQAIDRVASRADRPRIVVESDELPLMTCDELRIERVVSNLLDNALKYTPSCAGIVVRLRSEPGRAVVSVCDAGPGLTPADLSIVFDRYRRCSSSNGRPGSGLGLFVSKRIVEAHGGSIGVESVHGWGARFFFSLPTA